MTAGVAFFVIAVASYALFNVAKLRHMATGKPMIPMWEDLALENAWPVTSTRDGCSIRGGIDGKTFSAQAMLVRIRSRYRESVTAHSVFRVPLLGPIPTMEIRRPSFQNKLRLLVTGQRPMLTDVHELDALLLVTGDDVDAVVGLLRKPAVRPALKALYTRFPGTLVTERAVTLKLGHMFETPRQLDTALELLTTVATAIEASVESVHADAVRRAIEKPDEPRNPDAVDLHVAMMPDQRLQVRPLYTALRQATRGTSQQQRLAAQRLRVPPYRFEIEVRSVSEDTSRTGAKTGNYRLNGVLTHDNWRVEMVVTPERVDQVLTLVMGDVVRGLCLLEDLRPVRRTVEAKLNSDIEIREQVNPPGPAAQP